MMYPVGSEFCLRLTGNMFHYAKRINRQHVRAVKGNDTRKQAESSKASEEFRKKLKKLHPEFFAFTKKMGANRWILKELEGNIFIVFYKD